MRGSIFFAKYLGVCFFEKKASELAKNNHFSNAFFE
jgi:hypothetical protein